MDLFFPGMIVGIIILQTSIIAPTLFKGLQIEDFGRVIRSLWPKFFVLITVLGAATLLTLFFGENGSTVRYGIAGATTAFAALCYGIIPATNRATDEGNDKRFNLLHKTSVYLTVAMLLINIGYLFA
ncbi:MAG: hypothetical protein CMB38_04495 [Euryarchaeota archaeon]|mgnify:FL=1|nr:hypothetical protein [Euryarchaeota archaeon]DAC35951.1 MAG TPA: DUF4149 domain-containing protein [Candidatus Poseidoniales archaeon]|tara:strand:- start:3298 stop:3678 length:381 start_codon:yes stop_codon:yes gene_type:complete